MAISSLFGAQSERDMYATELAHAEAYENASVEPDDELEDMTRGQLVDRCRDLAELAEDMYAAIIDIVPVCAENEFLPRMGELGLEVRL